MSCVCMLCACARLCRCALVCMCMVLHIIFWLVSKSGPFVSKEKMTLFVQGKQTDTWGTGFASTVSDASGKALFTASSKMVGMTGLEITYTDPSGAILCVIKGKGGLMKAGASVFVKDAEFGSIDIRQLGPGVRCVTIDRGGGHLGVQGYVYFPDAQGDGHVHEAVFGGFEGRAAWHLIGGWYAYDSTEE